MPNKIDIKIVAMKRPNANMTTATTSQNSVTMKATIASSMILNLYDWSFLVE